MTAKELIMRIINDSNHKGYDMEVDDPRKLIALAYYMGREEVAKELCDSSRNIFAAQMARVNECRYWNMASYVQGGHTAIYHTDYAGEMTTAFGGDHTEQTLESLSR